MIRKFHSRAGSLLAAALLSAAAAANAAEATPSGGTSVELVAEASRPAANDLVVAVMYVEQAGQDAATLARQVNRSTAAAFEQIRGHAEVKAQSAGTSTWPVYGKNGNTGKIEGWRMRTDIRLESRNPAAMSELIGKLQSSLALAQVNMQPAAETRRKAIDEATVDAIRAFEQRAALVATTQGKRYRIRHLNIADTAQRPVFRMRSAPMMAEAVAAPLEGGESDVSVTINGSIELVD